MTEEGQLGRAAARGGLWGVGAEASTRASQSLCFFVLAGVLTPAQFGTAAVAFVCVQVANSLTYAGLGAAVQVLGPDARRDRTAMGLAVLTGLLGAAALAGLAVPICAALGTPEAVNLVRLVALALPLAQTSEVLSALLDRELRFRTTGQAVVVASVVSAAVGLGLAFTGAGAEALVAQGVVQPGVRLLALLMVRPSALRLAIHPSAVRQLWATGKDLLVGQVFATASGNVDNIAVSSLAGAAALGGYGFAYNLTTLPFFLVGLAVGRVALPIYGALRARAESVRPAFLTALEVTSWLGALPLGFLAVAGPDALVVIFGHKWDPVAYALRLLAVHGWLRTVESTSGSVLIAVGEAAVMRRVQQFQLFAVLLLLWPLVDAKGPLGAAIAVTAAVVCGTTYSLRRAAQRTGAPLRPMVQRVLEAGVGGAAGGAVALAVLRVDSGALGLTLSLLAATGTWLVLLAVVRPRTVAQAWRSVRRRQDAAGARIDLQHPPGLEDIGEDGAIDIFQFVDLVDGLLAFAHRHRAGGGEIGWPQEEQPVAAVAGDQAAAVMGQAPAVTGVAKFLQRLAGHVAQEDAMLAPGHLVDAVVEDGQAFAEIAMAAIIQDRRLAGGRIDARHARSAEEIAAALVERAVMEFQTLGEGQVGAAYLPRDLETHGLGGRTGARLRLHAGGGGQRQDKGKQSSAHGR